MPARPDREPFIAAECDGCGSMIERREDQKACPKCSGYFHKGNCYHAHYEREHRN
jgi:hypothetical protein